MIIKTKHDIDFNINAESVDDETANSFIEEMKKIRDKYIGQPMCTDTVCEMKYDVNKLMANPKYENIQLTNNQFFNTKEWDLNKLLTEYKKHYPLRFDENKTEYTRIEVNNMLFDLNLKKVIGSYRSPAVCADLPSYNEELFDGTVTVEVPIFKF